MDTKYCVAEVLLAVGSGRPKQRSNEVRPSRKRTRGTPTPGGFGARPVSLPKRHSLSNANLSQSLLKSFQISTSARAPCVAPAIFLFCSAGSRRAKLASFHDTAEGVRPKGGHVTGEVSLRGCGGTRRTLKSADQCFHVVPLREHAQKYLPRKWGGKAERAARLASRRPFRDFVK